MLLFVYIFPKNCGIVCKRIFSIGVVEFKSSVIFFVVFNFTNKLSIAIGVLILYVVEKLLIVLIVVSLNESGKLENKCEEFKSKPLLRRRRYVRYL